MTLWISSRTSAFAAIAAAVLAIQKPAAGLDKQGSAHGGEVEGASSGFAVSGNVFAGWSLYNPTYAARPNNTGLTFFRAGGHLDVDLVGRALSIPLDVNLFTDRLARPAVRSLVPSELDVITGLVSTWRLGPGAIEVGARVEHDMGLDDGGYAHQSTTSNAQTYADIRVRYLWSLAVLSPSVREALGDGDLSGWFTLGWFAVNPGYFARPDNTGLALFRYAAHLELSGWKKHLGVGIHAAMFTDKQAANIFRPSELDLTPEVIVRWNDNELHVAYERDMPVDQGDLVQHFVYMLTVVPFDLVSPPRHAEPR